MSLEATAQVLEVMDNNAIMMPEGAVIQFEMPEEHGHHEHEEHEHEHEHGSEGSDIIVSDSEPQIIDVKIDFLSPIPGAPEEAVKEPAEPIIEVHDVSTEEEHSKDADDNNDAKGKGKKNEKWDWASKGPTGFLTWVQERFQAVPKHSGYDSAGLERACAYLERLDSEISKAMRLDVDGELDSNKIEEVRVKIEDGISKLSDRLDKIKENTKKKRKKKADDEDDSGLIKEAQKITGVKGIYVSVDLLTSRIARLCINGMVSAGHDIEKIYASQVKKYKLNDREQAMVMQLLSDMGYPLRQDRGYLPDEDVNTSSSDGFDWATNYKG